MSDDDRIPFPPNFEKGAADVLFDDLGDIDDDDTVRVQLLLDELITALEEHGHEMNLTFDRESSLVILRHLRAKECTAGELRAKIRDSLAELAAST